MQAGRDVYGYLMRRRRLLFHDPFSNSQTAKSIPGQHGPRPRPALPPIPPPWIYTGENSSLTDTLRQTGGHSTFKALAVATDITPPGAYIIAPPASPRPEPPTQTDTNDIHQHHHAACAANCTFPRSQSIPCHTPPPSPPFL